jgi:hypothetical protein
MDMNRIELYLFRAATSPRLQAKAEVVNWMVGVLAVAWLGLVTVLEVQVFREAQARGRELHGIASASPFVGNVLRQEDADLLELTSLANTFLMLGGAVVAMVVFSIYVHVQSRIIRKLAASSAHIEEEY